MTEVIEIATRRKLKKLSNVAAYARVSTEKDSMLHSLNTQVDYYRELITSNPNYRFKGVYADYAVTGTKGDRKEFNALIEECLKGNVDLIITKSVARFARNLLTTIEVTRKLAKAGVDVYFEEQGVHSISNDGELMLSLIAAFAQEESRNNSERMKWRVKDEFKKGHAWQQAITGYKFKQGTFEIIPEEAELVKKIYALYLSGKGLPGIARTLEKEGYVSKRNRTTWNNGSIRRILTCYTYTGNLILQTTFKNNYLEKIKTKNNGELKMFHVANSHEAIIPLETWQAVQKEIERRDSVINHVSTKEESLFKGMLVCSHCGKHYTRKVNQYGSYYICPTFSIKGKAYCQSKQVREEPLIEVTRQVLDQDVNKESIESKIHFIDVEDNNILIFHLKDGRVIEKKWSYKSRSESWTPEMRKKAAIDAVKKGKNNGKGNN